MPTVTYTKTVSDANVRAILQRIANYTDKNITVHSGDRDYVPHGGSRTSLHLHHRAADFHITGMSDAGGFAAIRTAMNSIFDATQAYEFIHHGQHTGTGGPHLHIGRYGNGRAGYVKFKTEGLTQATKNNYSTDQRTITTSGGAPVSPGAASGVTVDATILSPNVGVFRSVGIGGVNQYNDTMLVQTLLNRAMTRLREARIPFQNIRRLVKDGDCGRLTKQAITVFQRDVLRFRNPDGRIDPGGKTIRSLYVVAYGDVNSIVQNVNTVTTLTPPPQTNNGSNISIQGLLTQPRIRAMLEVLALSEGTENTYGRIVFGLVKEAPFNPGWVGKYSRRDNRDGVIVTDFSRHPRAVVQTYPGQPSNLWSSAAGRYQFLRRTWDGLGLPNFSASNQDIGCVMLFRQRRMIEPLQNGNFDLAVQRGCLEWASLPDANKGGASHYGGQPSVPLPRLRTKYQEALARFGG